jgi:nitrite reductase/ring-hydroxylating ferredoxin subunit
MNKQAIARWNDLQDRVPAGFLVGNVDIVAVRFGDELSVF